MRKSRWVRGVAAIAMLAAIAGGHATAAYAASPAISTVSFTGSAADPTITIAGIGFGAAPTPTDSASFGGYDYGTPLYIYDLTANPTSFYAGYYGSAIGLANLTYSDTLVSYQFGAEYTPQTKYRLQEGDSFTVYVKGVSCSGTVSFTTPTICPAINAVSFTGSAADPTITIAGIGFGSVPPTPTSKAYPSGDYTGYDYGYQLYIKDSAASPTSFEAGRGTSGSGGSFDLVGLVLLSYNDTRISYQFGTEYTTRYYPNTYRLQEGDSFTVYVKGVSCSGTVSFTTPTICPTTPPTTPPTTDPNATPELGSGELLATGLLSIGAVLLYRRRRTRSGQQQ